MQRAIPALIVSGYLGSGKTTLVGHLLEHAQAHGHKLAIISNEFGDTGIDRALLDAGEDGFVELDGGCVCCRLSDALGETLEMILTQVKPDRLVLETSGVALPGEILVQFWRPPVDELIEEEVVTIVVDGEHLLRTENLEETFLNQLEAADIVLLNKCDLLSKDEQEQAEKRLATITQGQPTLHTTYARVDPTLLFPPDPDGQRIARRDSEAQLAPHTHERFNTQELSFPGVVEEQAVLDEISSHGAIRAKGFVRTAQGVQVIQGVGARIEMTEPDKEIADHLVGRVVLIIREDGHEDHAH